MSFILLFMVKCRNHIYLLVLFFLSAVVLTIYSCLINCTWVSLVILLWYARSISVLFYLLANYTSSLTYSTIYYNKKSGLSPLKNIRTKILEDLVPQGLKEFFSIQIFLFRYDVVRLGVWEKLRCWFYNTNFYLMMPRFIQYCIVFIEIMGARIGEERRFRDNFCQFLESLLFRQIQLYYTCRRLIIKEIFFWRIAQRPPHFAALWIPLLATSFIFFLFEMTVLLIICPSQIYLKLAFIILIIINMPAIYSYIKFYLFDAISFLVRWYDWCVYILYNDLFNKESLFSRLNKLVYYFDYCTMIGWLSDLYIYWLHDVRIEWFYLLAILEFIDTTFCNFKLYNFYDCLNYDKIWSDNIEDIAFFKISATNELYINILTEFFLSFKSYDLYDCLNYEKILYDNIICDLESVINSFKLYNFYDCLNYDKIWSDNIKDSAFFKINIKNECDLLLTSNNIDKTFNLNYEIIPEYTNFVSIYFSLLDSPSSIFLIVYFLPLFLYVLFFICKFFSSRIKKN